MRKVKVVLIIIFVLALIMAGLFVSRRFLKTSKATNTTYKVKQETYENAIEISGTISAAHSQTLQALSSGTVVGVYVSQGDIVQKGDVIIQMEDSTEKYNLAKMDYELATTRISGSKKEIELKETNREALVKKVEERKVTATYDGIIADIDVKVGDSLEAKDSVGTLVDASYLTAEVEIAETDVGVLEVGQQVEFNFPAYKKGTVYGYVVGWPAIGTVTSRGATVVKAKLRIDEYPKDILPNFSFSGKIKIAPDETFLVVSKYAIGRDDGKAFVIKEGSAEKISVKVVPYDKNYVKISGGDVRDGDVLTELTKPDVSGFNRNRAAQPGSMGVMGGQVPARK